MGYVDGGGNEKSTVVAMIVFPIGIRFRSSISYRLIDCLIQ